MEKTDLEILKTLIEQGHKSTEAVFRSEFKTLTSVVENMAKDKAKLEVRVDDLETDVEHLKAIETLRDKTAQSNQAWKLAGVGFIGGIFGYLVDFFHKLFF